MLITDATTFLLSAPLLVLTIALLEPVFVPLDNHGAVHQTHVLLFPAVVLPMTDVDVAQLSTQELIGAL